MSWTSETNIKGPKGDKGDPGIQGPPGASGSGSGDVVGPAGAIADRIAVYSGVTGKLIKDGGKLIADLVAKAGDVMTGNLTINKSTPSLVLQKTASGQSNQVAGYNGTNPRWVIFLGDTTTETGSGNTGSNLTLASYTDAGAPIGSGALVINRATGVTDFKAAPTVNGVPMAAGNVVGPASSVLNRIAVYGDTTGKLIADGGTLISALQPANQAVRYDAAQGLTANQTAQARANIWVTKKNYIMNGGMQVNQENFNVGGTASNFYPADQWVSGFSSTGAYFTVQAAGATPGGSPWRLRVGVSTADTSIAAGELLYLSQRIEGQRVSDLRFGTAFAKTITIQFGVKAPAGTYSVVVTNTGVTRSYVAEYVVTAADVTAGDVIKSVTIPGCTDGTWATDNTTGLDIRFGLMCGTTYQLAAGSWTATGGGIVGSPNQFNLMGSTSNVFELFDVSLTEGNVAPPFQLPDYAIELNLCQRYWQKLGGSAVGDIFIAGYATAGTIFSNTLSYSVEMRVPPTTLQLGTWTNTNVTSTSFNSGSKSIAFKAVATATGTISTYTTNATCYISLNARL